MITALIWIYGVLLFLMLFFAVLFFATLSAHLSDLNRSINIMSRQSELMRKDLEKISLAAADLTDWVKCIAHNGVKTYVGKCN